jgi:mRNA interferase HigB
MRIVAKSTLKKFWEQSAYKDAESVLTSWYEEVRKADWKTPQAVKAHYSHASLCKNNRVVFNIGGNKYRLVVEMQYRAGIVWIKFIGTHEQYDKIKVEAIDEY